MTTPVQETHYGQLVFVSPDVEAIRRDACLCLHCGRMGMCRVADVFYKTCVAENVALAVSRCPAWQPKAGLL